MFPGIGEYSPIRRYFVDAWRTMSHVATLVDDEPSLLLLTDLRICTINNSVAWHVSDINGAGRLHRFW